VDILRKKRTMLWTANPVAFVDVVVWDVLDLGSGYTRLELNKLKRK
jgi:hypothetical protein